MKKSLLLLSILVLTSAFGPPTVDKNNRGVENYKAEKYQEAFQDFVGALSKDSVNPTLHFNLANGFHKAGENEKALTEFESVENSPHAPQDLKFDAMFNAGNVAVEMKDYDRAMSYYQRALDHKPDSMETKTNIELALKEQQKNGGGGSDNKEDKDKDKKDNKDNKDNKDEKDKDGKDKKDQQQGPAPKPTPKPFKSQALNESDVKSILEELKRQEQAIRAKQNQNRKKPPESQIDKDW